MPRKERSQLPEQARYTRYYEHDGALRAYSNRMLWFGLLAILLAFILAVLLFYVRVQPPTIIRIAANGDATVVGGETRKTPVGLITALAAGNGTRQEPPADIEGRAIVRKFLENYLTYTPSTVESNWANALNLMTSNFRTLTMGQLRDQDILSKVKDDGITSAFQLRKIEAVKGEPWTYDVFGVKEIHRIHNKVESTDRLVTRYYIRLLQTERSESVPSGLMVAEYGEHQMVGERHTGLAQATLLIGDSRK
jgi:hypothetical protein